MHFLCYIITYLTCPAEQWNKEYFFCPPKTIELQNDWKVRRITLLIVIGEITGYESINKRGYANKLTRA
jgi:hypothetical protein